MSRLAGDPIGMRALASRLENESDALAQALAEVDARARNVWWQGRDADAFRARWSSIHGRHLRSTVTELRAAAATLRREASVQERVSRA